jgi:5-methyltetrahydrofolate--homocysteine methyltransferase
MSGLLVKSTAFMKDNLEAFNEKGITVPVILGGAALTPKFVHQDCQAAYKGKVVYGKDAFADLHFMDKLMPAKHQSQWDDSAGFTGGFNDENKLFKYRSETTEKAFADANPDTLIADTAVEIKEEIDSRPSEAVETNIERPTPPFWGTKLITADEIDLAEIFEYLDLQALVAGQWQFRKPKEQSREEYDAFLAEKVYPVLEELKQKVIAEKLLDPTVIYGYFPCNSQGNILNLYNGNSLENLATSFTFPRQKSGKRLCIADFFASKESGVVDVFPMQAVTVGEIATEHAKKLFAGDNYTEYLYYHGLAVQTAEALAEWTHAKIRKELGFGALEPDNMRDMLQQRYQGSRYSFGYPACPNIQDQYKQLELLGVDRIGMYMDESEQIYPEQSTTAIIVYHPTAKYFST